MQKNTSGPEPHWGQWPAHPAERGQIPAKQILTTTVILVIQHSKPIEALPDLIAARAWSIDGVTFAEVAQPVETVCKGSGAIAINDLPRIQADIDRAHAEEVRLGMHEVGSAA